MSKSYKKNSVYEIVTNNILEQLDKGVIPWRKPWDDVTGRFPGIPANAVTKRPYSGINCFLLAFFNPSKFPYFATYNQVKKMGGSIRKGARSHIVTYYVKKYFVMENDKKKYLKESDLPKYRSRDVRNFMVLKYYKVFNVEDIEGVDFDLPLNPISGEHQLDSVVSNYANAPRVLEGGTEAKYKISKDVIEVPSRDRFESIEQFYSVVWHELVHSTGHVDRLNRESLTDQTDYELTQFEELVAELGAAFLCTIKGISFATLNESASYIQHWIDTLTSSIRKDPKLIFKASRQAYEAVEYILNSTESKQAAA